VVRFHSKIAKSKSLPRFCVFTDYFVVERVPPAYRATEGEACVWIWDHSEGVIDRIATKHTQINTAERTAWPPSVG